MRTFRFLLFLVSLLLVFPAPVHAAEGRTVYLVLDGQANVRKVLLDLAEAQDRGEIISFELYDSPGFVQVELPSADLPASLGRFGLQETKERALEAASASIKRPEGGGGPGFEFSVLSSCFSSFNLPANARVIVKVYNGTNLISSLDKLADGFGFMLGCLASTVQHPIVSGNKVVIKVYPPGSKTASASYVSRIPQLKTQKITKQQATLAGVGTPGKMISGWVRHYYLESGYMTSVDIERFGQVGSDGQWQLAFNDNLPPSDADLSSQGGGYGLKSFAGGDRFLVTIHDSANISYLLDVASVPAVSCLLGGDYCVYEGRPSTSVDLTVEQAGIKHLVQFRADRYGITYVRLPEGLYLQTGAVVSATGADPLVMPEITVQLDRNTGVVSGVGPANRWMDFILRTLDWGKSLGFVAPTNKNKAYSYTTTNFMEAGIAYFASVNYFNPVTGNITKYNVILEDK